MKKHPNKIEQKLNNFRNYKDLMFTLTKGINIIYGNNAQGKTNLLESIYVLGLTKSHRSFIDNSLINNESDYLTIEGIVNDKNQLLRIPSESLLSDEELRRAYLRGVFLVSGSLNDPKTSRYHLEFLINDTEYSKFLNKLLNDYKGEYENFPVERKEFSIRSRKGIGVVPPVDPNNQDTSILTGSIDISKMDIYPEDDPRIFSLNGAFNVGNRGLVEFIEVFKNDVEYLHTIIILNKFSKMLDTQYIE